MINAMRGGIQKAETIACSGSQAVAESERGSAIARTAKRESNLVLGWK